MSLLQHFVNNSFTKKKLVGQKKTRLSAWFIFDLLLRYNKVSSSIFSRIVGIFQWNFFRKNVDEKTLSAIWRKNSTGAWLHRGFSHKTSPFHFWVFNFTNENHFFLFFLLISYIISALFHLSVLFWSDQLSLFTSEGVAICLQLSILIFSKWK